MVLVATSYRFASNIIVHASAASTTYLHVLAYLTLYSIRYNLYFLLYALYFIHYSLHFALLYFTYLLYFLRT